MDRYNHWLPKLFSRGKKLGITISADTVLYSCPAEAIPERMRRHEEAHKLQWREMGKIKFTSLYLFYLLRYGYNIHPMEIIARKAEIDTVKNISTD